MNAPPPPVRYFTVEEANQTLPLVKMIVRDIVDLYNDLHRRRERLASLRRRQGEPVRDEQDPYEQEILQMEEDLQADITRLQKFVDELRQVGAELKDPFIGLIDFPTKINGREAFLCWKHGEEEVAFWHERDAGFDGRLSLFEGVVSPDSFGHGYEKT